MGVFVRVPKHDTDPKEDPPCEGCPDEETDSYDEPCISCIAPMEMGENYVERMRRDVREERAPHPGEVLGRLMELSKYTVDDLKPATNVYGCYWYGVLMGKSPIRKWSAEALAKVFDTSAEFWLKLQRNYDAQKQAQADHR